MVYNLLNSPKMLKDASFKRKNPEFAEAINEIVLAHRHADRMVAEGSLTQAEADDYEAHLHAQFLEALPAETFHEMMKDGRLDELQALAGHDGTRDGGDVEDTRKAIDAKIKAHALDEAWMDGRIDSEYHAKASRDIKAQNHEYDEARDNRIGDGDYEGAAVDYLMTRNDVSSHEKDLAKYLDKKYGDAPGPAVKRNSSYDKPEGYVEHNVEVFAGGAAFNQAIESLANEPEPNDGIIDLDQED